MKPLTLFILAMLCLNFCHAQKQSTLFINMGKSLADKDFNQALQGINKPTTFSIDCSITSFLSFGGYLAHKKLLPTSSNNSDKIIGSDTSFGLRGHFLFAKRARLSMYMGGMIGVQLIKLKKEALSTDIELNHTAKKWQGKGISTLQIGCRYFPKTWFGYFIELGFGNEPATIGISIKI